MFQTYSKIVILIWKMDIELQQEWSESIQKIKEELAGQLMDFAKRISILILKTDKESENDKRHLKSIELVKT